MGMDSVELIMAVEEAFEFEIPDEEASECETVGKLYALVLTKLGFNPPPYCVSSRVFYQARRALIDLLAVPRRSIAPSTPLERLLPATRRREDWQSLSRALGASLPELQFPRWGRAVSTSLGWALFLTCLAAYFVYPFWAALLISFLGIYLWDVAGRVAAPLAVHVPAECGTSGRCCEDGRAYQVWSAPAHGTHLDTRSGVEHPPRDRRGTVAGFPGRGDAGGPFHR